jgi:hypothetical protein
VIRRAVLISLLAAECGCVGQVFGPPEAVRDGGAGGDLSNLDVYTRLRPTCVGCHTIDVRPFFASLDSFENLIVYQLKWVVPGDPASSALLGLLKGTASKQMPPAPSDSFATLADGGKTQITLSELEEWIRRLQPRIGPPYVDAPRVRRKTAEQVVTTLYAQLGLAESDFYDASINPLLADAYAVRSPDAIPFADAYDQGGVLFRAMGGPHRLEGQKRNDQITPTFLQALIPVSQAWCRTAFGKTGNTAVLSKATLADTSASAAGAAAIKANIDELYLRMLGEAATSAEVDDLYQSVFLKYEGQGARTAWTAVCAALVRDPLWILY